MAKKAMILKQQKPAKYTARAYNRCKICGRPLAAKSYFDADGHTLTEFEVCNGFSRLADNRMLTGDNSKVRHGGVYDL